MLVQPDPILFKFIHQAHESNFNVTRV